MSSEKERPKIVVDGKDIVLGRLASYAAKQALLGKMVIVVNCKDAVLTGRKNMILKEYKATRERGGNSLKGPHFPKSAERIAKRTIRGMLRYTHGRGKDAFKRVRCYDAIPAEFASSKLVSLPKRDLMTHSIKLGQISEIL